LSAALLYSKTAHELQLQRPEEPTTTHPFSNTCALPEPQMIVCSPLLVMCLAFTCSLVPYCDLICVTDKMVYSATQTTTFPGMGGTPPASWSQCVQGSEEDMKKYMSQNGVGWSSLKHGKCHGILKFEQTQTTATATTGSAP
jgi:hypothetical protein